MAQFQPPLVPPKSQVEGNVTIGAGHPAPVQAPPKTSGLPVSTSNSATGEADDFKNKTPKKHDSKD